jgi:ABC-2 type transport system ATP-binding protein
MPTVSTRSMIEVEDLHKSFGAVTAVAGVSFTLRAGEVVGFLGPNGAGKTTTMRVLAGVFPPTRGRVRVAGRDPISDPIGCRRRVGYFPEFAPYYPELTVGGYLAFVARAKRVPRRERAKAVENAIDACALGGVAGRRVGTLSKGFRQRVGLAQALLGDPAILILDEPTIGLDPEQVVEIRDLVRKLRGTRTVLFSSHILSEVEALCERVIVIARGRLVGEGTPAELGTRLGRRQRLVVRVEAEAAAVEVAFGALPGVLDVRQVADRWHLDAAADVDVTGAVADVVRRQGWTLRELRQETLALEEIFLQLVRGDDTP